LKHPLIAAVAAVVIGAASAAAIPAAASAAPATPAAHVTVTGPLTLAGPGFTLPRTHLADARDPKSSTWYSSNWSGYADTANSGKTLTSVSADYTIPNLNTAKCDPGTSGYAFDSDWVGLDGFSDSTVEQTGTANYCYAGGHQGLYAWYEMYPLAPVAYSGVNPGDAIDVSVTYDPSNRLYHLILDDVTINGEINVWEACPSGNTCENTSAEAITETPGGGPTGYNLADYGQTQFTDASVSGSGVSGNLSSSSAWTNQLIDMEYGSSRMATPSALEGGQAFNDVWNAAN
jgi:peptidase A4-like protein